MIFWAKNINVHLSCKCDMNEVLVCSIYILIANVCGILILNTDLRIQMTGVRQSAERLHQHNFPCSNFSWPRNRLIHLHPGMPSWIMTIHLSSTSLLCPAFSNLDDETFENNTKFRSKIQSSPEQTWLYRWEPVDDSCRFVSCPVRVVSPESGCPQCHSCRCGNVAPENFSINTMFVS